MLSSTPCIYIVLTLICWLTMEMSADTTCYISGNESRINFSKYKKRNNETCESNGACFRNIANENIVLSERIGTLFYEFPKGENKSLTLVLANITSVDDYKQIHLLTCTDGKTGKLRFGQNINDKKFNTVFDRFENYTVTQPCSCFGCMCGNGISCNSNCSVQGALDFFCSCIFTNQSEESAVKRTFTSTTVSKPRGTKTSLATIVLPQTTTKPFTSTSTQQNATPQSDITLSTNPSDRLTDYVSAARQSEENGVDTIAIVTGLVALVVLITSVTVFICLRRRKWNKKPPDCDESCITNQSYEETQEDKKYVGLDNNGYEEIGKDVHTYDMVDDPMHETKGELDYSYTNFGGQPKFQELMPTLNQDKTGSHEPRTGFEAEIGNTSFLTEAGLSQNDDYDIAKEVTGYDAHGQLAVNSNSFPLQDNYFVVEKSEHNSLQTVNNDAKCFVHETHDNDANERTEAMQSGTFSPGDDYFLLEESVSKIAPAGSKELTGIQGENYFLLEQQTASEANNAENGVYDLAHSRSHNNDVNDRKDDGKRPIKQHVDTYDHVRVGHAQTNGIDDGVYDELRKQNVRYKSDDVDNDYDHC